MKKNAIIATGSTVRLLPGAELSENVVTYESQATTQFARVPMSGGPAPCTHGYGLDNTGVSPTDHGAIAIDALQAGFHGLLGHMINL